jgi:hypothetical protein
MSTPMLPTVVSSWLDLLWVVDYSRYKQETVEREKPSSVAVLDTNRWHLAPNTVPRFKGNSIFCLVRSPSEWHRYAEAHESFFNLNPSLHLHLIEVDFKSIKSIVGFYLDSAMLFILSVYSHPLTSSTCCSVKDGI